MKRKIFLTLCVVILSNVLSYANEKSAPIFAYQLQRNLASKKVYLWTKNVWSTIEFSDSVNKALFYPYNESRIGFDRSKEDYDLVLMESQKSAIQFNLWNILIYHFLKGELTLHFPYDPNWYATRDDGFLFYPFSPKLYGANPNGNYSTDEKFRNAIKDFELLGITDYSGAPVAIMSIEFPGEDSISDDGNVLYYPREFIWYLDEDIVDYQIKETWFVDDSGFVVRKKIDAIAPVTNRYDEIGNPWGTKELFWIDFNQLAPLLSNYFYLKKSETVKKVVSFSDFFLEQKFEATIIKEDSVYVQMNRK